MRIGRKYWETIADNVKKAGWSWGCVSAIDSNGRTIWIADAHRGDGKRFIVHADEKRTAFLELERAICLHVLIEQVQRLDSQPSVEFAGRLPAFSVVRIAKNVLTPSGAEG